MKYTKLYALQEIRRAIDNHKSCDLQNMLRTEAYVLKPNVLGLKKLGMVDYLANKLGIVIVWAD